MSEKFFLNHAIRITSGKLDNEGNTFVTFYYEGITEDSMIILEELEKMAKKCMVRLGKKKI